MYSKLPNLVIGFHGCDKSIFDKVIKNGEKIASSQNSYDWLGHGIYFWENSLTRAYNWARKNSKIKTPAAIGAIIDLGYCLNLTDYASSDFLRKGYEILKLRCEQTNNAIPQNRKSSRSSDVLLRDLDCAVIEQIHDYNKQNKLSEYDSVRGIFIEGGEVYPGSEFREKTHVQLCVVNPNCIKGVFAPMRTNNGYPIP